MAKQSKQDRQYNGDLAARRPQILCSICFHSFVALAKTVRLFTASLYIEPMCSQICSLDIFVHLQPFGCNIKRRLIDPLSHLIRRTLGSGLGLFDCTPTLCSYYLPTGTYGLIYYRFSLSYLVGSKSVSVHPSDNYHSRSYCFVERQ